MANGNSGWGEVVGKLGFGAVALYILYAVLTKQAEQQDVRDAAMHELMVTQSQQMTKQFERIATVQESQATINKVMADQTVVRNELMKQFLELTKTNQTMMRELLDGR